jgi:hypothetical protein
MNTQSNSAELFQLVGKGVAESQYFELAFVMAARLALKQSHACRLEDIVPVCESTAMKQPIKALLSELDAMDDSLADRISNFIDDRNRMIHRLFRESGWPAELSTERRLEFEGLCARVAQEGRALTMLFSEILLAWMKRFPDMSASALALKRKLMTLAT